MAPAAAHGPGRTALARTALRPFRGPGDRTRRPLGRPALRRARRTPTGASAGRPRLAWIPFGLGPRGCEGAGLATVEALLLLAVLLKRFRFRPVPGHPVVPIERFVLRAADDIRMLVSPRAA
ncbi:cytochrome P450 [Kitasatospora sp. NPDC085464]|uniref:cytochrome P450 n=1 Tax=Kitasatospora sp. NPDC085464 TaxID=3364063 RepID=UPI0037CC3B3B